MSGVFGGLGKPYPAPAARTARAQATSGRAYEAARRGGIHDNWRPGLRSADADWLDDRDDVIARARDIGRNEGVGASASMRVLNASVGFRWNFTAKPNHRALGISYEQARELGQAIDAEWEQYAYGIHFCADAERSLTFGQLLRLSAAHIFNDGEMVGLIEWASDEPTLYKTRLRVVDPDRLSNPHGRPDTPTMRGGVEKNATGAPLRYWLREGHPDDVGAGAGRAAMVWTSWERYSTTLGRPQVLHAFDKLRAGQTRGVTRFASVLKLFKSFSQYTDKTIEAAALNALFLGFVKSNAGPSAVKEGFEAEDMAAFAAEREDFYEDNPLEVNGVQLPVLGPDDEIQMQTTARDTSGFDGFTRSILRLIAAALGVTYEELSMDFSTTNYASARAALMIAWKETLALRGLIEQQIVWPFFAAWLEEAIDIGRIILPTGAPSFYDAMDAYVEGRWRGPGRGHIDPTKEIAASAARIEAGISTLEDECAEYDGSDWEEKLEQRAREFAKLDDLGLRMFDTGLSVSVADQITQVPYEETEEDPRADKPNGSAVSRVRRAATSPEHEAFLDARPTAA